MIIATSVYLGNLRVENKHQKSGSSYLTDAPTDNNGRGEAFSPTDTVATALANCMLTIMGIYAERENINLKATKAEVTKIMAANPRRISKIIIDLTFPEDYSVDIKQKLEQIAYSCPVFLSLHPDIEKEISFKYIIS